MLLLVYKQDIFLSTILVFKKFNVIKRDLYNSFRGVMNYPQLKNDFKVYSFAINLVVIAFSII